MSIPSDPIIGAVAGIILKQAEPLASRALKQFELDKESRAFKRALKSSLTALYDERPDWASVLFDETFMRERAAPLLGRLLGPGNNAPAAEELALAWAQQFSTLREDAESPRVTEAEVVAGRFLEILIAALRNEPDLDRINSLRASFEAVDELKDIKRLLAGDKASAGTVHDYLSWLIAKNLYLDPRGTQQTHRQVQLLLDDIFVSLSATAELESRHDRDVAYRGSLSSNSLHSTVDDGRVEVDSVDLVDTVTVEPRVVLLGDPGGGKSTLVRYLALHYARERLETFRDRKTAKRLPVLVRVASLTEQRGWRERPLIATIVAAHQSVECTIRGLDDLLTSTVEQGGALLMFDGLDEVADAKDRQDIGRKIDDFLLRYGGQGNHVVVTSRIEKYWDNALSASFHHFAIRGMSREQQDAFLARWCRAVEDAQTPDLPAEERQTVADREISAITRALDRSEGVARLAVNPLMLRILALIHRTGATLPERRIELYKLAAETLARTWRVAQGVPESALIKEHSLTRLLSQVAMWMHTEKPEGTAARNEVREILAAEWCRLEGLMWDPEAPLATALDEVEAFLEAVRVQTGLFVERAPDRFGFMHLTFEEYYTARALTQKRRDTALALRSRLHDPRWREPILLALGFVGLDYPDDSSELVEAAVLARGRLAEEEGFRPSEFEEFLKRDFLFALNCLADGVPIEPQLEAALSAAALEELRASPEARWSKYRAELSRVCHSIQTRPHAQTDFFQKLYELSCRQGNPSDVQALSRFSRDPRLPDALRSLSENAEADEIVRREALARLGLLFGQQDWYPEFIRQMLRSDQPSAVRAWCVDSVRSACEHADNLSTLEPLVIELLGDADRDERDRLTSGLISSGGGLGDPDLLEAIFTRYEERAPDSDPYEMIAAISWAKPSVLAMRFLAQRVTDKSISLFDQALAAEGIIRMGMASLEMLEEFDALVNGELLTSFDELPIEIGSDDDFLVVVGEDWIISELVRRLQANRQEQYLAPLLIRMLAAHRPRVDWLTEVIPLYDELPAEARRMLGRMAPDDLLDRLMRDDAPEVRAAGTHALLSAPVSEALEAYTELTRDPSPVVRASALAAAASSLPTDAARAAIEAAVRDPAEEVRTEAYKAASRLRITLDLHVDALLTSLAPEGPLAERAAAADYVLRLKVRSPEMMDALDDVEPPEIELGEWGYTDWPRYRDSKRRMELFAARCWLRDELDTLDGFLLSHLTHAEVDQSLKYGMGEILRLTTANAAKVTHSIMGAYTNWASGPQSIYLGQPLLGALDSIAARDRETRTTVIAEMVAASQNKLASPANRSVAWSEGFFSLLSRLVAAEDDAQAPSSSG